MFASFKYHKHKIVMFEVIILFIFNLRNYSILNYVFHSHFCKKILNMSLYFHTFLFGSYFGKFDAMRSFPLVMYYNVKDGVLVCDFFKYKFSRVKLALCYATVTMWCDNDSTTCHRPTKYHDPNLNFVIEFVILI